MKNYCDILGVKRGVSDEDLKKAYRAKAMEWHPDRHNGKDTQPEAEEKFKDIVEAYENLQKGIYTSEEKGSTRVSDDHVNDMMKDFMSRMGFNFGSRQREEYFEQVNVDVSMEDLYNENTIPVTIRVFEEKEVELCTKCDGQGQRTSTDQRGNHYIMRTIPCDACRGQGFKPIGNGTEKNLTITATLQNLTRPQPLGKVGSFNPLSGEMNNVMVKLKLKKSANYYLVDNGMGLVMTLPVAYEHLRDGKKLRVMVFNNKVTVNVPPKPSVQEMLVIPGKGMPIGNNHRGSLYIKLDLLWEESG